MAGAGQYAKFIVAIVGAGIMAALGVVAPDTDLFNILTVAAAMVTAAGVLLTPNAKPVPPGIIPGEVPPTLPADVGEAPAYEMPDGEGEHRATL